MAMSSGHSLANTLGQLVTMQIHAIHIPGLAICLLSLELGQRGGGSRSPPNRPMQQVDAATQPLNQLPILNT